MRIVVVGAGVVGFHLAERLSAESHKMTIIDSNSELIQRIDDRLNVQAIQGNAASLRILRQAKVDSADLVIAVTDRDETNITVSLLAKHLGASKCVVRLRNSELSGNAELMEKCGADASVNPIAVTAEKIQRLVQHPGAFVRLEVLWAGCEAEMRGFDDATAVFWPRLLMFVEEMCQT